MLLLTGPELEVAQPVVRVRESGAAGAVNQMPGHEEEVERTSGLLATGIPAGGAGTTDAGTSSTSGDCTSGVRGCQIFRH